MVRCSPIEMTRRHPDTAQNLRNRRGSVRLGGAGPATSAPATTTAAAASRSVAHSAAATAIPKGAAVREHDVLDAANRVLRLRLVHVDRDDITRCERRL